MQRNGSLLPHTTKEFRNRPYSPKFDTCNNPRIAINVGFLRAQIGVGHVSGGSAFNEWIIVGSLHYCVKLAPTDSDVATAKGRKRPPILQEAAQMTLAIAAIYANGAHQVGNHAAFPSEKTLVWIASSAAEGSILSTAWQAGQVIECVASMVVLASAKANPTARCISFLCGLRLCHLRFTL